MKKHRWTRGFWIVALAFFASACSEAPTQPTPEAQPTEQDAQVQAVDASQAGLLGGLLGGGAGVNVIERNYPLWQDVSRTRTITPSGGFITLWQAGLTLYFPPGAVESATEITVTAPKGNLVGYHMAPHGIEFDVPVVMVQSLWGTTGFGALNLTGAYFEGGLSPVVSALELLPLHNPALPFFAVFGIDHFSGYVVATN